MNRIGFWFVWLFVFTVPFQRFHAANLVDVYGIGTINRLVGIGAFLVGVTAVLGRGWVGKSGKAHVAMYLFFAWAVSSYIWTVASLNTWSRVITFIQMAAMVWLLAQFARTSDDQRRLLFAWLLGSCVTLSTIIGNFMAGNSILADRNKFQRFGAFENDPNDQALGFVISLVIALYLLANGSKYMKIISAIFIPFAAVGVLLAGSRGGMLALAVVGLSFPFILARYEKRLKIGAMVVFLCAAVAIPNMVPDRTWARLFTITDEVERASTTTSGVGSNMRLMIWQQGLKKFPDSPIVGVGSGAFAEAVDPVDGDRRSAHNAFMSVLVELGTVGIVIFLITLGSLLFGLRRLPKSERPFWFLMMLVWSVGNMFIAWEHYKETWTLFGLMAARITWFEEKEKQYLMNTMKRHQTARLSRKTRAGTAHGSMALSAGANGSEAGDRLGRF